MCAPFCTLLLKLRGLRALDSGSWDCCPCCCSYCPVVRVSTTRFGLTVLGVGSSATR
ncbi:MAG: hypothetical protein ACLUNQ_05895 [Oscillospiraceae bacterium]